MEKKNKLKKMEGGVGKMTETQSDTVLWMAWLVVFLIVFCGTTFLSLSLTHVHTHTHTHACFLPQHG